MSLIEDRVLGESGWGSEAEKREEVNLQRFPTPVIFARILAPRLTKSWTSSSSAGRSSCMEVGKREEASGSASSSSL